MAALDGHGAGLFKEWESPTVECQLLPGDMLALYTDGVTESFNGAEEEFGEQRLIEALMRHREQAAESIVPSVIRMCSASARRSSTTTLR